MINFVIAHKAEASAILQYWKLKKSNDTYPYPVYQNNGIRLIISGSGKTQSAAATSWLAATHASPQVHNTVWLNVGIAGHQSLSLGSTIIANKLLDGATERYWFPTLINNQLPQSTVCTIDVPTSAYPDSYTYEMEATGFYQTAMRFSTTELVHCIKVISDNRQHAVDNVSAEMAKDLVSDNIQLIDQHVQTLQELASICEQADTQEIEDQLFKRFRFTVTQQHMLRRLLTRHLALYGHLNIDAKELLTGQNQNSKALLKQLSLRINQASPDNS